MSGKTCKEGYFINEKSMRCQKNRVPCREGYVRNDVTKRCNKVGAPKKVRSPTKKAQSPTKKVRRAPTFRNPHESANKLLNETNKKIKLTAAPSERTIQEIREALRKMFYILPLLKDEGVERHLKKRINMRALNYVDYLDQHDPR